MSYSSEKPNMARTGEWIAALVGAINCVLIPLLFAQPGENAFPFPGLYFIQIALVGVLVLVFVAVRPNVGAGLKPAPTAAALPWVAAGILLAFVVLGGFSIGPFLIPAFVAFVITGILVDRQTGGPVARHAGWLLVAAVVQAAVMGLMIQLR